MHRPAAAAALAAALTLMLLGCSGSEDPGAEPAPEPSSTGASPSEGEEPTSEPPSGAPATSPSGRPGELAWQPVPGSTDTTATVSGAWTLLVPRDGGGAALSGPRQQPVPAPRGYRVSTALIDGDHAVVVFEDAAAERADVATVVDLASGDTTRIDRTSDVPTTVGGSWALGSGLLVHATTQGHDYCLAVVDLLSGRSDRGPCVGAPPEGIREARVTPGGITAATFDGRPSCYTLNRVEGQRLLPLRGVAECRGWEAVATETSQVWSVVEDPNRVEQARFFADTGGGPTDLGRGTSGTLTWCGDAAYFVRDPQRDSDPARLVRVEPDGSTEVVYESPGRGRAFLSEPRCGGTDLTVSAFTAAGDEQVTAQLG